MRTGKPRANPAEIKAPSDVPAVEYPNVEDELGLRCFNLVLFDF